MTSPAALYLSYALVRSGLATLLLFKATNVVAAYSEAASVVQELISEGASAFTELGVEAAKAALSFEILSYYSQVAPDYGLR